jgi:hypothetical protein
VIRLFETFVKVHVYDFTRFDKPEKAGKILREDVLIGANALKDKE